ncbi:hypothetical protein H6G80_17585 [Nostoc sp. FACHB-87]|uniref:hypothetical protein n=1 Tax=Nostocaceae TaxID=1162 RepID=UPI0016851B05|nr:MULTISPECIES: hypothetical protein [Nostocaceae]MBD2298567.1 hypothetical protein [Nostoc sp. FACHB-190]MBD2455884.1 hypothetical protein [Nostoc sp. FACHB-87]MBD2474469.1 hypothetical protein [Anabaena sp. FACHB-83]
MSRQLAVILEDEGACSLPPDMDLKNEGLIFGNNLPVADVLLEDIALKLGITPLSAFMKDEGDDEDEAEELQGNSQWHNPKQGLDTVEKLFSYLLAHPQVDKSPEGAWWLLWDLRALELILRKAVQKQTRFYLVAW